MRLRSLLVLSTGLAVIGSIKMAATGAAHGATCSFNQIASAYETGARSVSEGKYGEALSRIRPLAQAGFGPAQRELAKLYENGRGVKQSLQ